MMRALCALLVNPAARLTSKCKLMEGATSTAAILAVAKELKHALIAQ